MYGAMILADLHFVQECQLVRGGLQTFSVEFPLLSFEILPTDDGDSDLETEGEG